MVSDFLFAEELGMLKAAEYRIWSVRWNVTAADVTHVIAQCLCFGVCAFAMRSGEGFTLFQSVGGLNGAPADHDTASAKSSSELPLPSCSHHKNRARAAFAAAADRPI